eukprot:TRINITY_DN12861_c0_g1_i1.p1 TRINITY_DN12861_c0_g1~~TRINITY_DN12861_c0_g1_i1.p1  ORF type:complete len:558 (+),score=83.85 TRINITY_DN12861_c0_g1_i1:186-1859(+)
MKQTKRPSITESTPLLHPFEGSGGVFAACCAPWERAATAARSSTSFLFGSLADTFGWKILVLLFVVQHLFKGFTRSLTSAADPYIFKVYHVPAPTMQVLSGVTDLPWAMKPAVGLISDVLPVCGYNKAPYCLLTSLLGVMGLAIVGAVPYKSLPITALVMCMFLHALQLSTTDLLTEAKYAEKIQANPRHGPSMLSYVWLGLTIGSLVAALLAGTFIQKLGPKAVYMAATVPAAFVMLPVILGFFEEKCLTAEEVASIRQRFQKQKEACFLCGLMLCGTILLTICGVTYQQPRINAILAIVVGVTMIVTFSIVLSPVIAKFNTYSMIQSSFGLSIRSASFYFYTDTPSEFPDGPHFSPFFYNTVMGVSGAVFSLLGIYSYNRWFSSSKNHYLLIMANGGYSALCMLDVVFFRRQHRSLGIPDHVFLLGSSAMQDVVGQWMWMPQVVIFSQLCPPGMEAMMYSLLAGCTNLGSSIASNCGAWLLEELNCKPNGSKNETAEFDNLWLASTIATVLPLCTIVLIFSLVPNTRQDERILEDDTAIDAMTGSLWRRWTGDDR